MPLVLQSILLTIPGQRLDENESAKKVRDARAKAAIATFLKAQAKANEDYDKAISEATKELLGSLEEWQEDATKNARLDDALAIREFRKTVEEESKLGKDRLQILAALYGTNADFIDVTDRVRQQVGGRSRWAYKVATKDYGDPAPGAEGKRMLIVRYKTAGKVHLKIKYEGLEITLP